MEVDSKHLKDVVWNDGVLTIEFRDESVYDYLDVPSGVYVELMASTSKSSFFRTNIKGSFEFEKRS